MAKITPEKRKHYADSHRTRFPEKYVLYRAKNRAKRKGLEFDLTIEDINIPTVCPVLGIPLVSGFGKGSGYRGDIPSIDRINSKLGYIKGNVRVISFKANCIKNDATIEELEKVLEDLKSLESS